MKIPRESPINRRIQIIGVKKRSDRMLGKTSMNFDDFCQAIDELIPENMFDFYDGNPSVQTRMSVKGIAKYMIKGGDYYEFYLNQWYDFKGKFEQKQRQPFNKIK